MILRSFPFCICFTCFKWKDFDSERSPRSYKKCLGRDLLASRAPPQCSPSLSLSPSLFQNQCMSAGQTACFQKLHTSGSGAKVSWVIMSHRNKMNKQQTTSHPQKVLSCTRSVESFVSNVGQADPRQAQGCIKGSLPTSRQIQHSRAWTGRRPKKMVVSWYLFVVQWWFYLFIGVPTKNKVSPRTQKTNQTHASRYLM